MQFPGMPPNFPGMSPNFPPGMQFPGMPPNFPPGMQFPGMPPNVHFVPTPQPVNTGSKQNLDNLMKSKNIMENLITTAKKSKLKEISKILLTDEDVVYLVSKGCQLTLLTECLESSETMKEQLGDVAIVTEPVPENVIILRPYRLVVEPEKPQTDQYTDVPCDHSPIGNS